MPEIVATLTLQVSRKRAKDKQTRTGHHLRIPQKIDPQRYIVDLNLVSKPVGLT